jgi:hypothetical protein
MENMSLIVTFFSVMLATLLLRRTLRRKLTGHYDERQELIRGKANQYGFATTILCTLAGIFLLEAPWYPLDAQLTMFLCVLIGIAVQLIYCIFHAAYYFPPEPKPLQYAILVIVLLCNLAAVVIRICRAQRSLTAAQAQLLEPAPIWPPRCFFAVTLLAHAHPALLREG